MGQQQQEDNAAAIVAGYFFAFILPVVGLLIGLTQINRGGVGVIFASVLGGLLWYYLLWA